MSHQAKKTGRRIRKPAKQAGQTEGVIKEHAGKENDKEKNDTKYS